MPANVVRDVAMQDVGQDERRGAVACAFISMSIEVCGGVRTYDHRVDALRERTSHGLLCQQRRAMGPGVEEEVRANSGRREAYIVYAST